MTIEEILWALFKTDLLILVVIVIYAMAEWDLGEINDEVKATTKYQVADALFKTFITVLPMIMIGLIWV